MHLDPAMFYAAAIPHVNLTNMSILHVFEDVSEQQQMVKPDIHPALALRKLDAGAI